MSIYSTQQKIKTQIAAFLFNNRADVLRGEMYRALCLYVLNEVDEPCDIEEITSLVAYSIAPEIETTSSLRAIVAEEINTLSKRKQVLHDKGKYVINSSEDSSLPNTTVEDEVRQKLLSELSQIAISIKPHITDPEIHTLLEFYSFVCELVAIEQSIILAQGLRSKKPKIDFDRVTILAKRKRLELEIDRIIDGDRLLRACFSQPTETLVNYELLLIQVNMIWQLLLWDPDLKHLQETVLKGKTLFLDTSILFPLMLSSHFMHDFIESLLTASIRDLSVKIKVHEITLREYEYVVQNGTREFNKSHRHLRDLVRVSTESNIKFEEIIKENLFLDYLNHHSKHIDLGSWQRYQNRIDRNALIEKLTSLGIDVDVNNAYVPTNEFHSIRNNVIKGSVDQVKRGKRSSPKTDGTHDAQLYYLIKRVRNKSSGPVSMGYDTYLITLDGSLPYFAQHEKLVWTDTFFLFPNQWYEMAFPFLRMQLNHNSNAAQTLTQLAFSPVYPMLEEIIPLHIFGYVFDLGGSDLSLGSIYSVIEALHEERLLERLDPANKDIREREEARMRVQRIIADTLIDEQKLVDQLSRQTQLLEKRKAALEASIKERKSRMNELKEEVFAKEGELEFFDKEIRERQHIDDIYKTTEELKAEYDKDYQEKLTALKKSHEEDLALIHKREEEYQKELNQLQATSEAEVMERDKKIVGLENSIKSIEEQLTEYKRAEETAKQNRQLQIIRLRKVFIASLMSVGILAGVFFQYQYETNIVYTLIGVGCMILGLIIYLSKLLWWSFALYGIGLVILSGVILISNELEMLLWIIPMGWEILVFSLDRWIDQATS